MGKQEERQGPGIVLGHGQYHLAVAGGCTAYPKSVSDVPTRYREVVLTVSKLGAL